METHQKLGVASPNPRGLTPIYVQMSSNSNVDHKSSTSQPVPLFEQRSNPISLNRSVVVFSRKSQGAEAYGDQRETVTSKLLSVYITPPKKKMSKTFKKI